MHLANDELSLLGDALDSHEYWQLSDPSDRNSGNVAREDESLDETNETERQMLACRRLSTRLHNELVARRDNAVAAELMCWQHLHATNDANGNPRRVFVAYDHAGDIAAIYDEGYRGRPAELAGVPQLAGYAISASTYRDLKRREVFHAS